MYCQSQWLRQRARLSKPQPAQLPMAGSTHGCRTTTISGGPNHPQFGRVVLSERPCSGFEGKSKGRPELGALRLYFKLSAPANGGLLAASIEQEDSEKFGHSVRAFYGTHPAKAILGDARGFPCSAIRNIMPRNWARPSDPISTHVCPQNGLLFGNGGFGFVVLSCAAGGKKAGEKG